MPGGIIGWELKPLNVPHCMDLARLDNAMKMSRQSDFQDYFNSHRSMQASGLRIGKPDMRLFPEVQHGQPPVFDILAGHVHGAPVGPL